MGNIVIPIVRSTGCPWSVVRAPCTATVQPLELEYRDSGVSRYPPTEPYARVQSALYMKVATLAHPAAPAPPRPARRGENILEDL